MTEKLKPCPFCGGRGEVHRSNMYGGWIWGRDTYTVECPKCNYTIGLEDVESWGSKIGVCGKDDEYEAIATWNKRVEQSGWVKTSERVPKVGERVWVYIPVTGWHGASMKVLRLNDSHLWVDATCRYYPERTFWMPLPEEPEEVEE